jgi:hypothetical protein
VAAAAAQPTYYRSALTLSSIDPHPSVLSHWFAADLLLQQLRPDDRRGRGIGLVAGLTLLGVGCGERARRPRSR